MGGGNKQMEMVVFGLMLLFLGTSMVKVEGIACCSGSVYRCCYAANIPIFGITPAPAPATAIGEKRVLGRKAYSIIPSIKGH